MKNIYILLFTILISGLSFGQELLTNGDLESWDNATTPTGWSKAESVTEETTTTYSGSSSAKTVASSTSDLTQNVSIEPGESYTISFWYNVETGDGSDARIWSYWLNGTSTVSDANTDSELRGPSGNYLTSNNSWQQYTVTVTAPSTGVDGFRFEVRTYSGATVYWDNFSFIDNNTLSTKYNQIEGFTAYPNPTSLGYVSLSSKSNTKMDVAVFDILGKQMLNKTVTNNKLDVTSLTSGVYIMKVTQENAMTTKKLVIK